MAASFLRLCTIYKVRNCLSDPWSRPFLHLPPTSCFYLDFQFLLISSPSKNIPLAKFPGPQLLFPNTPTSASSLLSSLLSPLWG